MEKKAIPATVICTELFIAQGKNTAFVHGFKDYPVIKVSHPITNATKEELYKEAERVWQDVVDLLLQ